MRLKCAIGLLLTWACSSTQLAFCADASAMMGPVKGEHFHATFVRLGFGNINGLLYEPDTPGPHSRVAVVYTYPRANFISSPAEELVNRGYRVLMVKSYAGARRGVVESQTDGVAGTSKAITYLRTLPGIERVVVMGWGTGARLVAFYENVAEHGPAACQDPEVLFPCKSEEVTGLAKPDGIVMFDPGLGAFTAASDVDPAYDGNSRSKSELDMFATANGFDPKSGSAHYTRAFLKRYFAAQSARNDALIEDAVARWKLVQQGKGPFPDDEPFVVPGAVNVRSAASLHRTDLTLLSHTKQPHLLLKADGSTSQVIVQSIRPATGEQDIKLVNRCCRSNGYTVRSFLANDAVRTGKDFAITADDIAGVDWKSSNTSTPVSAQGISVPALVMTMTCFQFVVPSEMVYDRLASKDKTFAAVEGAEHSFTPCKPQYGDTKKRAFDFVDSWLGKSGRF